jgi:PAS domain S-box-containing protein
MDITEPWKVQEALRESEHHLRRLIKAIPALIWCATPGEGKVVYANQRFCDYAGRTLEELLDSNWITLIHPDDAETTISSWRHALETGEPHEITHRFRRSDGTYRWLQTLAEPLRGAARPDLPACPILDLQLPDISGLDLQGQLSGRDDPPIVFITGHGDIPSSVRAIRAGAIDFLPKPLTRDTSYRLSTKL